MSNTNPNMLTSRILKTSDIKWRDVKFLQQDDFKELSEIDKSKLKKSLIANRFIQPFFVWQDADDTMYCLDGRHRYLVLEELQAEGVNVPELLPGMFVECENKKEASKLVLVFSSIYAKITKEGLAEFVSLFALDLPNMLEQITLPEFSIEELLPLPTDLDAEPKEKPATLKITFASAAHLEQAIPAVQELLKKYEGSFYSVSAGEI